MRSDQVHSPPLLPAKARLRVLSVLGTDSAIESEPQAHAAPFPDPSIRYRTASMTCTSARLASGGSRYWFGRSISTPPSDMVGASIRPLHSERASAVRELSAIASPWRIPLLIAGLATGFHQSDATGVDTLQGRGVDESAVAETGGAGTVKLPRHQIIAIGEVEAGIMLVCSVFQTLCTCPAGTLFTQRGHRRGVAAGFAGDVAPVAQGVQPPTDTGQSLLGELADGG
ncbi:Uncharacterised protein [Mycobacterium tuberculosis]|nr:Uncharacterised protein [Mycobacterium tuberculosis]